MSILQTELCRGHIDHNWIAELTMSGENQIMLDYRGLSYFRLLVPGDSSELGWENTTARASTNFTK